MGVLKKIKFYREQQKLSQDQLAKKSGVSRVTISLLENGRQTITTNSTLLKLAKALKIEVGNFF